MNRLYKYLGMLSVDILEVILVPLEDFRNILHIIDTFFSKIYNLILKEGHFKNNDKMMLSIHINFLENSRIKLKYIIRKFSIYTFQIIFKTLLPILIIGDLLWLWNAIQLGSISMFITGLIPIFWLVTSPVGFWIFLFDTPEWVISIFR